MPPKEETPAKKHDFVALIKQIQEKKLEKDETYDFGGMSDLKELGPDDFIKMPEWWSKPTKLPGIPINRITTIAGTSDSGKSSCAVEIMLAAQQQGFGIIYIETENKTTREDFVVRGLNPEGIIVRQSFILEEAFEDAFKAWDEIKAIAPEMPLLIIFDSIGNAVTQFDQDLDLTDNTKPGGKGAATRRALGKLVGRVCKNKNPVAVVLISYTYDNIGSQGKTNAGGNALHLYSSLMYQTTRKAWYERQVSGTKVRAGADVIFKLFKNHIRKHDMGAKQITYRITKDGFELLESKDD